MSRQLLLKLPSDTPANNGLTVLLGSLIGIAREYDLGFSIDVGDCISPVCVRGYIELETAEEIKQRALAHVHAWETRGTK